jgi:hypothetical protein
MFPALKQSLGGHKFEEDRDMKTLRPITDMQQKNASHDMTGAIVVSADIVRAVGYQSCFVGPTHPL